MSDYIINLLNQIYPNNLIVKKVNNKKTNDNNINKTTINKKKKNMKDNIYFKILHKSKLVLNCNSDDDIYDEKEEEKKQD